MKKITQIFILFIVIIILSSLTFINIFKESFELSDEEKTIMNNLITYDTKINEVKNLLPQIDENINLIKNNKINLNNKINSSTSSLSNINSTNLTIQNQLDKIQKFMGNSILTVKKLGIPENVQETPFLLNLNLLSINSNLPEATMSSESSNQPVSNMSSESSNQPVSNMSSESSNQLELTTPIPISENINTSSSNQDIAPFINLAKKSKESFINLLNNIPARKPVEHFNENVNWRTEWNSKLESISSTKQLPLPNTDPKINDNETIFYIVQNPNLEKNLENTSSNIIKMQMENITEILRDKWIKINRT
jgi:hypothetical protein